MRSQRGEGGEGSWGDAVTDESTGRPRRRLRGLGRVVGGGESGRFVVDVAAAGKGGAGVAAVEEVRDGCEGVFASLPAQMGGRPADEAAARGGDRRDAATDKSTGRSRRRPRRRGRASGGGGGGGGDVVADVAAVGERERVPPQQRRHGTAAGVSSPRSLRSWGGRPARISVRQWSVAVDEGCGRRHVVADEAAARVGGREWEGRRR